MRFTVLAYLRVSTDKQDLKNRRLEILEYARKHDLKVDGFIEAEMSWRLSVLKHNQVAISMAWPSSSCISLPAAKPCLFGSPILLAL